MRIISSNTLSTIVWIHVSLIILMSALSFVSLVNAGVNVITQDPLFLYNDIIYMGSIVIATLTIISLIYIGNISYYAVIPLLILWLLILTAPYMVYIESLPLYNDQLGFVAEALKGVLYEHITPLQGELSSLGHAYFTAVFIKICNLDPLWGVVVVQLMLPIIYVLPLLMIRCASFHDKVLITLTVLAVMLNPIFYSRSYFAWIYLIFFTVYLYNKYREGALNIPVLATLMLIYIAFVVSHPTSLIVPIMLFVLAFFDKRLRLIALLSIVTWFTVNLTMYISGSLYSLIVQLMAIIEHPANPLPLLIAPPVTPVMKFYNYLRELTVFLGYLIGLIASTTLILRFLRGDRDKKGHSWIILYLALVILQVVNLMMNRWGMVPYHIYVFTVLPILISITAGSRTIKLLILSATIILLMISPITKWGFSAIAFPTLKDIVEITFIARHIVPGMIMCDSGAHVMLWFYYWLYNVSASPTSIEPLPTITVQRVSTCDYIAVFYRSFNIHRLGISEGLLMEAIMEFDNRYSVIYKNEVWTIWLR